MCQSTFQAEFRQQRNSVRGKKIRLTAQVAYVNFAEKNHRYQRACK